MKSTLRWALLGLLVLAACSGDDASSASTATLTRAELMNPETCKECHETHYREWKSSMHAYATEDPVFRAMNARGQEETDEGLGDFCLGCHAPMAVRDGMTVTGDNLDELGPEYQGITCYFCHNVDGLEADHISANNPLTIANDTTMRAALQDPAPERPSAHDVQFSSLHDGRNNESSKLCGTCHDIKTPGGVHLERTFAEWEQSIFNEDAPKSCGACHMPGLDSTAAVTDEQDVPQRRVHSHLFAGVDSALTEWPDVELQRAAIECELHAAVRVELVPSPSGEFRVILEANTAHGWPSGATQDRRAWVQFTAYDADDTVIFESGNIAQGERVLKADDDPDKDPNLFAMYDRIYGEDGGEVHMFWEAAESDAHPDGYESFTLPPTTDLLTPHTREWTYQVIPPPARVRVSVHIRPMGLEVIDDLIDSGHLDADIRGRFQDVELTGTVLKWTLADAMDNGYDSVTAPEENPLLCPNDWLCILHPDHVDCAD